MTFLSCLDEKSNIIIGFNKVAVPEDYQATCGSKDYLCNQELSTALIDLKFVAASHFIHSHSGKNESRNQKKHQYIQEAIISNIAKIEVA